MRLSIAAGSMDKLREASARQEIKGIGQQIKGKVQEGAGRVTGSADLEADGDLNRAGGRIREKLGETGRVVADALGPHSKRRPR